MSDRARLNAILNKLGQEGQTTTQLGGTTSEFLTGILRIVDETVLARDLIIETSGKKIVLHIAKRSLIGTSGIVETDLAEADSDRLTSLGAEIKNAFLGAKLELNITRPENRVDPSAVGASVAALADAWAGVDAPVESILELAQLGFSSVYWKDNTAAGQVAGDGSLEPDILDREKLRARFQGDRGMLLLREPSRDSGLFFVFDGASEALILADTSLFSRFARSQLA